MLDISSDPQQAYRELVKIAAIREAELRPMLQPYIDVTDRYGVLISSIVMALGKLAPSSDQDSAIRDLLADVFDYLYEARHLIIIGKPELAYPLARRAYESLSLMVACNLDEKLCKRWMAGKQISNEEYVGRLLNTHRVNRRKRHGNCTKRSAISLIQTGTPLLNGF
jgi:hypothetical protein